jgi:hypothetical protein
VKIPPDSFIRALSQHEMIMGERVHQLQLRRYGSTGTEDDDLVFSGSKDTIDDPPEQPMAGTGTIWLSYGAWDENYNIFVGDRIIIDNEPIGILKYRQVKGRVGEVSENLCFTDAVGFHERLLSSIVDDSIRIGKYGPEIL